MRSTFVLTSLLFFMATNSLAMEPLQADLNPANYTPFVTYFDAGSNQNFYYDNQANTFFVYGPTQTATAQPGVAPQATYGDPTGMLATVNYYRSLRGLHPWSFDTYLYNAALNNNAWQRLRGMGHHDVPSAQNSAWGPQDVMSVLHMWAASPGHAATLFGGYSFAAIAFDGVYWTLNAR